MRCVLVMMMVLAASPAGADAPSYNIHGFVTYGTGELTGHVADDKGKPLAIEVRISGANGREQKLTSDRAGQFRAKLDGGAYSIVYTEAEATVTGQVAIPRSDGDTEIVEIHDTMAPKVLPVPKADQWLIPDYSATAIDKDVWTRAWLLLDVDAAGNVARVKLLKKPGFDLEDIAVKRGLALTFAPARDYANRPVRSLVMWVFEWPQYSWLRGRHAWDRGASRFDRVPPEAGRISCRGSGPPQDVMRDCAIPTPRAMFDAPWLGHPR
ncbi:MAG TPA: hypothetical protein VGO00_09685 [Kofleriaceae bacterium]|nr:hypothetical protein [Kofleriaceae bacterium]